MEMLGVPSLGNARMIVITEVNIKQTSALNEFLDLPVVLIGLGCYDKSP